MDLDWLEDILDRRGRFVTRERFDEELAELRRTMATQADIDAITTQVNQVATDLDTARSTLQAEINSLAQNNPSVDVSGLQAAVAPLDGAVQQLAQLTPGTTPPPAPAGP